MAAKYDLVVLGAGPAGEKGAAQAAYFGKRVAVVDPSPRPGGIAVSTAGIPTKTLREGAIYLWGLGQSAIVVAAGERTGPVASSHGSQTRGLGVHDQGRRAEPRAPRHRRGSAVVRASSVVGVSRSRKWEVSVSCSNPTSY